MMVLVINCGSSSLKYQLFDMNDESVWAKGLVDRIGSDKASLTHKTTFKEEYQPYGPIELSYITSLNCELALDTLLSSLSESILRIWTSSTNRLESVGGKWSRPWLKLIEKDPKNAQIWEFPWNKVCSLEPNR